jgi:hypothetical protein
MEYRLNIYSGILKDIEVKILNEVNRIVIKYKSARNCKDILVIV